MNEQNLKPQAHKLTVEEASKGGRNSGKARRQKKALNEVIAQITQMQFDNGEYKDLDDFECIQDLAKKGVSLSVAQRIAYELLIKAVKGDLRAIEMLMRASEGTQQTEKTETKAQTDSFIEAMRNSAQGVWNEKK